MKRFRMSLFLLLFICSLAGTLPVEGANYITAYVTGKIISYTPGKSIELLDVEGERQFFIITESTRLPESLKKGMKVEVQANDVAAVAIEVLSR